MMTVFLTALSLVATTPETLAKAEALGSDLALGQICEALQRTTVNFAYLMEQSEYIHALAASEGISPSTIENLFEKGHTDTMAQLEKDYPLADQDPQLPQLVARCDVLIVEQPGIYGPPTAST